MARLIKLLNLAITLGLLLALGSPVVAATNSSSFLLSSAKKNYLGSWNLDLRGTNSEDEFNKQSLFTIRLHADLILRMEEWLSLKISPSVRSSSGHTQTETLNDGQGSQVYLREATVNVIPTETFKISLGSLNMSEGHSALLLDRETSFPGARAILSVGKSVRGGIFAEGAIPVSSNLTTNTKEKEATPGFQSAGIMFIAEGDVLEISAQANAFQYSNLPSAVALESGLRGNSVNSTNAGDSNFLTEFKGSEAMLAGRAYLGSSFRLNASVAGLQNSAAPQNFNQAYLTSVSADLLISDRLTVTPSFESWRIEPDASVSQFNESILATNRVGYRGGLALQVAKKFRIKGSAGEKEVIYESANQSRENFIELKLETLNAEF